MADYNGYLLVSVDVTSINTVKEIRDFQGVVHADSVFGPWDVVVYFELNDYQEIKDLVRAIRALDSVTDSISLLSMGNNLSK